MPTLIQHIENFFLYPAKFLTAAEGSPVYTLILLIIGGILIFMGWQIYKLVLVSYGFLIGCIVARAFLPETMKHPANILIIFGSGIVGAIISIPLQYLFAFLALGSSLSIAGILLFCQINTNIALFVGAFLFILGGLLGIFFFRVGIMFLSSFLGGYFILTSITSYIYLFTQKQMLPFFLSPFLVLFLALLGTVLQYKREQRTQISADVLPEKEKNNQSTV